MRGGKVIAAEVKEVVDLIMGGEETLSLPGRLEPLHLPLPSSGRLMGVLRSGECPICCVSEPLGH
jgi:hypothetical protein